MAAATGMAQNAIDNVMKEFSSIGNATFTTAVQRNPHTRKVEKVVKCLTIEGDNGKKIIDVFKSEAAKHNTTQKISGGNTSMLFTTKNKASSRIYMISYENYNYYPKVKATTITSFK